MSTPAQLTDTNEARLFDGSEIRAVDKGGSRKFEGRACPYDSWALIGGLFEERIMPGTFTKSLNESAAKLPLLLAHEMRDLPLGHLTEWREGDDGLYGTWMISEGSHADNAWESVREGSLSGLSVHFRPVRDEWEPRQPPEFDRVTRTEARLMEVSLCSIPTWTQARVTETRTARGKVIAHPKTKMWAEWLQSIKA